MALGMALKIALGMQEALLWDYCANLRAALQVLYAAAVTLVVVCLKMQMKGACDGAASMQQCCHR